jgi:hypothetical protein
MTKSAGKRNKQKWIDKEEFSRFVEATLKRRALIKSMGTSDGRSSKIAVSGKSQVKSKSIRNHEPSARKESAVICVR